MGKISILVLLFACVGLNAQQIIKGKVIDKKNNEVIIGAAVRCGQNIALTDLDGSFNLAVEDNCTLIVSFLGYANYVIKTSSIQEDMLMVKLEESAEMLETTTITATKFEQRLSESTVSVDVLKPSLIKATNTNKVDEVINKLPGVQVIGGQANIRGGSGFSYGAGSRVMVLLDDMPALQVDAGYANWADLPIEALGQIEVVKGASSALYGSSALNGIIHFRRQTPTLVPETNAFVSMTAYGSPSDEKYKWWDKSYKPYLANIGVSHSRKAGKWDITAHGYLTKLESFARETYENRGRLGFNLKYKINDKMYIGINSLYNQIKASDFFIWRNAIRGIYEPFPGTISSGSRKRFNLDPYLQIYDNKGGKHLVKTRYFYTNNDNNNNQQNQSSTYYSEYQYSNEWAKHQLQYSMGAVLGLTDSKAELFGNESYLYTNAAAYLQLDKKFASKLSLSGGLRYEYNKQQSPDSIPGFKIPGGKVTDGKIISRVGLNYAYMEYSSLRLSWGQGYRYPTVTERFISTNFGGFTIFPNPLLLPEFGWSSEVGIKQGMKLAGFQGFIDLSAFISEYEDMIEFTFLEDPYGFKPINIGNTRITGYETSLTGKFNIFSLPITMISGYTFINPKYKNFDQRTDLRENLSTSENVLKYRSKHSAKVDLEASYHNLALGYSLQYYSHMINIDKRFEEPAAGKDIFSIKGFRQLNDKGYTLMGARISFKYKNYKLSLLANNLLNSAYTVRPGLLEAPVNYALRLDVGSF